MESETMNRTGMIFMVMLCGMCAGCINQYPEEGERIQVVVTIPPLAEFVERVGGSAVQVTVMVPPGADPHTYEPTPGQLEEVSHAMVYVKVGSGIEFELAWMDNLLDMNKFMLVVDCSQGIQLIPSGEPDSLSYDPHIWLSPRNAQIMVQTICEALISLDPENEGYYKENKEAYITELITLDEELKRIFSGSAGKKIMVIHPAWTYFCRDYGIQQIPIEREGKEPTPRGIAEVIEQAHLYGITVIVASPEFNTESAEVIAREIGGRVILVSPLEKSYTQMLYRFVQACMEA